MKLLPPPRPAAPRLPKKSAAIALLALSVPPRLQSATVSDYSGVAYSPFGVSYSDGIPPGYTNAIKGFGNYNLGDIQGDLAFIDGLGISPG